MIIEQVRGTIIGGEYVAWQIFYDGKAQKPSGHARNDEEAIEAAKQKYKQIKDEAAKNQRQSRKCIFCSNGNCLYCGDGKVEVRIW